MGTRAEVSVGQTEGAFRLTGVESSEDSRPHLIERVRKFQSEHETKLPDVDPVTEGSALEE